MLTRRGQRLWIVSETYYPEEVGTGYVMTGIAEGLAPDFPVCVLCGQPTYAARGTRAARYERRRGVAILRCWSTTADNRRLPGRLLNFLTVSFSIFWALLRRLHPGEVVIVVTSPPLLPFLARLAVWIRRGRCILIAHDVYPEAAVVGGVLKPGSISTRLLAAATRRLYRSYHAIVAIGRDMQELLLRKTGLTTNEVVFIPNWADSDLIQPHPKEVVPQLRVWGLGDMFVVQYAGNLGRVHHIEALVAAARCLRDHPRIHFVVIGSGSKKPWLEAAVAAERLSNVTIHPHIPRQQAVDFLNACDVALSLLVPGLKGVAVPSRIYQIMAAGKPLIALCDEGSEMDRVIHEENMGWMVPASRPEDLPAAILEAAEHPERGQAMGRRARRAAEEKYPRARTIDAIRRLVTRLR